ncbi:MAG: M48 family metallopeptidase [Myxococcales bacterium]|nr:M48 family metallopeptidase [Myxococcales bacterium]
MAEVGALDFQSYVSNRLKSLPDGGREGGRSYAYISDHHTRKAFDMIGPIESVVTASVRLFRSVGKSQLLGHAVKVGPRQFPRVHALAARCADTLGIATPTVYIVNSPVMNAATFGTNDDSVIMVHSALIDHFKDDELMSVLGHECGHIHNNHVVYLTALHYLRFIASAVTRWLMAPAEMALMSWLRRAEITSDRAGLLCCKDLDVSTKALTKLALGSSKLYDELNMEAFIDQYDEMKESVGKYSEVRLSHPVLPKRVIALRHFADSELYRRHAAKGDGGISMEEVDDKVHEIIKVWG